MSWINKISPDLNMSLNKLLRKIKKEEKAYSGVNGSVKQLWVAAAQLQKEVDDLKKQVKSQERKKRQLNPELRKGIEAY